MDMNLLKTIFWNGQLKLSFKNKIIYGVLFLSIFYYSASSLGMINKY